tara:strand:- start:6277 stop:7290 length:1014 start_codon:yes stop_codon:yes gene_type:complete
MTRASIPVLLGDPRLPDQSKPEGCFNSEDLDQVVRLKSALAELSDYEFEFWDDHTVLMERLRSERPSFVLNFCDTGFQNDASLEQHVPSYCEMLGIACSGSGPVPLGLCYDKALVRALAESVHVPVPSEVLVRPGDALPELSYPAFIKPNRGDGSVGITAASVVHDAAQAASCVADLRALLPGATLISQEFLAGDEYGVGIIGNAGDGFTMLPVLEVDYSKLDPSLPRLLDYSSKTDPSSPYWNDIKFRAANLPAQIQQNLLRWCQELFVRLGLRDYARFDFRADANGQIKLMEVNPNPAWCWDGKLAHMASLIGERHSGLLRMILEAAQARCSRQA